MKYLLNLSALLLLVSNVFAQKLSLPEINISRGNTLHIVSPEKIQYVDISSNAIAGDLPLKNVLRLKLVADSLKKINWTDGFVVTIAAESFIAQYRLNYVWTGSLNAVPTQVDILPEHTKPLEVPGIPLTSVNLKRIASNLISQKTDRPVEKTKGYDLRSALNHIYSLGDYIFLDVSFENRSNLPFDIDQIRFKIEDQKITKATNIQSVEINPEFILHQKPSFKRHYRNVFVFKKFSYPGNKLLHLSLTEKQISGRTLDLAISYKDVLDADVVPVGR
jgi:conjugative transposon TraN protein